MEEARDVNIIETSLREMEEEIGKQACVLRASSMAFNASPSFPHRLPSPPNQHKHNPTLYYTHPYL